ncbi:MAG: hypothetical protein JNL75_05890 [Chitinophagales bacterium]|nr:hypothetical protein [Chitinophagales bacterium]
MKKDVEIININWEMKKFDKDIISQMHGLNDYGLYQIYADHYAYGKNALVYIGLAKENTFAARLFSKDRLDSDFIESSIEPTEVRFGYIVKSSKDEENKDHDYSMEMWDKYIEVSERLLIKTHTPALNSQLNHNHWKNNFDKDYLIINWGNKGSLLPEVSTFRNSYAFWNFDTPIVTTLIN